MLTAICYTEVLFDNHSLNQSLFLALFLLVSLSLSFFLSLYILYLSLSSSHYLFLLALQQPRKLFSFHEFIKFIQLFTNFQMNADGISVFETQKKKFSRLAHERNERYGGEFFRAKIIYKELLSAEGHRHYPLREPKCLRMTPDLMLPLGIFVRAF